MNKKIIAATIPLLFAGTAMADAYHSNVLNSFDTMLKPKEVTHVVRAIDVPGLIYSTDNVVRSHQMVFGADMFNPNALPQGMVASAKRHKRVN